MRHATLNKVTGAAGRSGDPVRDLIAETMRPCMTIGLLLLLAGTTGVPAQSSHAAGLFPTLDHTGTLSRRLDYGLYYFAAFPLTGFNRTGLLPDAYFNLLYLEQAVTCKMNARFSVTGAYVYQRANVVYDNYVNEQRFHGQAKYRHAVGKLNLSHRLRFDGRFIYNAATGRAPFTHRLRYQLGLEMPVNATLYLTGYEEAFFNPHNKPGAVYGENWAYAALGKKLNGRNTIEMGLLYITWYTGPRSWYNQYYLQLTWMNRLDLRRSKE